MRRLVSIRPGLARGRRRSAWLGPIVAAGLAAGCGPSFEAIQEGDLRFAHCDRLDLDPKISASHRLHCWREWRRVYTYGQTRDRIEYAQRRIAEVISGDPDPPFVLPNGVQPRSTPAVPNPALSAPPAIVPISEPPPAADAPTLGAAADSSCRAQCEQARLACSPGCESQPKGCQACKTTLEACLGRCNPALP